MTQKKKADTLGKLLKNIKQEKDEKKEQAPEKNSVIEVTAITEE